MAILLTAHQLTKSFSAKTLFANLSFTIESGDRIGLIGPNGAGKSTLLKILAKKIETDEGEISQERGLKVAYLAQIPTFKKDATILNTILEGISDPEDWQQIGEAREYFSRFELEQFGEEAKVESLSGGWKKRIALARELVKSPDLLLLDEPTNHLDIDGILWLENFLARAPFAVLTITHDRIFLQRIANRIIELDRRHKDGLLNVKGNYEAYLETRQNLILAQEKQEEILKNTLRRETEWLKRSPKARTTKQQARIDRAGELKAQNEDLQERNKKQSVQLDFQSTERSPKKLIEAKQISKSYGDRNIFSDLDLVITPQSRLGLLGSNGVGKSTLIRCLLQQEETDSGEIIPADRLQVAYFDQTRESLEPETSLVESICPVGDQIDYRGRKMHIKSYLDRFLFTSDQVDMPVNKLSGGEQSRLLIARLMLKTANVLILDEPTNDLDMPTLNVLEDCLQEFTGAIILVSHDRYFLGRIANQFLAFPNTAEPKKKLEIFSDLYQWETWHQEKTKAAKKQEKAEKASKVKASKTTPPKKKKLSYKEVRELETIEPNILEAEARLEALNTESNLPENISNASRLAEVTKEIQTLQTEIDRLYARWSELEN